MTETGPSGTTTYTWDARNKLVEAHAPTDTLLYGYDIHGIRTSRSENGLITNFVVDHNQQYAQVLAEVENGVTVKQYTYGDDLLSQTEGVGEERFFLYDGLGSTRVLTDASGAVSDEYFYEAFGNLLASTGSSNNAYRYTGEQYDPSLGQYYLRARLYNPNIGRFTQMDTWMGSNHDPITLHKYLYAHSDPANGIDPSGTTTLAGQMTGVGGMGILSTIASNPGGVALAGSLALLAGDGSRIDQKVTHADVAIARVRSKSCVFNGDDQCDLGIPLVVFGSDVWDATNHYWDAQVLLGLPQVLNRGLGYGRGWYTRLSVAACRGRGASQQCDEYPFNSSVQGGPANFAAGRVSLRLINGIHNETAGRLLNSMYAACGVSSGSTTESAFAAIPVPGGKSGFFCPGR